MVAFIFAVLFMLVSCPLWIILGFSWGILYFIYFFFRAAFAVIQQTFFCTWCMEAHEAIFSALFVPLLSAYEGIAAAFSPMSFFWNFARYDHPWWAFLITAVLSLLYALAIEKWG